MPWERAPQPSLRPERPREPDSTTRGMNALAAFQAAMLFHSPLPRASASGLSPGLESPGPLGRTGRPLASTCRVVQGAVQGTRYMLGSSDSLGGSHLDKAEALSVQR